MASGVPLASLATGVEWLVGAGDSVRVGVGRRVYVYTRGTTTQVPVFSDQALTVPLTQPLTTGFGAIPGYVAAEQAIDFFDVTSGDRAQAEPLTVADLIGTDGKIGSTGSLGLSSSVGKAVSIDGTYGLPLPTGVGQEMVWTTVNGQPQLSDIRFNGVSG